MRYLLDTDTVIYIIKHKPAQVAERFARVGAQDLGLSSISIAELMFGASKSTRPRRAIQAIDTLAEIVEVVPFDTAAARRYGPLRAHLERRGTPIGALDTLIAAHALALGAILVTNNVREFVRIPGLKVENWVQD